MNLIDVIIILPLLWALYSGYRKGIVAQVGILAGLVVGIFIAYYFGGAISSWLNINSEGGKVVAYIVVAGVSLFLVVLIANWISGLFNTVGLGIVDNVVGALLSLLKWAVIISILLCCFQWLNDKKEIVKQRRLDNSLLYNPVKNITSFAFPYLEAARGHIEDLSTQEDGAKAAGDSIPGDR